ncbi:MAG: penicillin-binding protein [Candidatus Peregrinibacteria bacterium]
MSFLDSFQNLFSKKPKLFLFRSLREDFSHTRFGEEPPKRPWWKKVLFFVLWNGLALGLIVAAGVGYIAYDAPPLQDLNNIQFAQSSVIYDRTGTQVLYTIYGEENRKMVNFSEISDPMKKAMQAAEDADFYHHAGLDYNGLARSAWCVVRYQQSCGGGSTIDQQLIKNLLFGRDTELLGRVKRKIQEVVLVKKLESEYSKDDILSLYLNRVPFGRNAYGIERAAQIYFGKSAKDLNIAESAFLAGLPQAPGRLSRNMKTKFEVSSEMLQQYNIETYAKAAEMFPTAVAEGKGMLGQDILLANGKKDFFPGRFEYVLDQMLKKGFITDDEYKQGVAEKQKMVILESNTAIAAPHFVDFVRETLEKKYDPAFLERGGLKIITSIDLPLQQKAEELIKAQGLVNAKSMNAHNGALVAMSPKTGEILAMVGSRDYFATEIDGIRFDGQVNVANSRRQTGSTFKPIAYATAFEEKGLAPGTVLMDVKTDFGQGYTPNNYDMKFHGPVSIRKALGNSYNIPAVEAGIIAEIPKVYAVGQKMGISFEKDADFYGSALPLGVAEITPLDLTRAYGSFANGGSRVDPNPILKITDGTGNVLYSLDDELAKQATDETRKVFSPETAYLINNILSDGSARGEGWTSLMSFPGHISGAKSGTSNGLDEKGKVRPHDAWMVGYTPQVVTAVWFGNNNGWDENPRGLLNANASGLRESGTVWKAFMAEAHKNLPVENFTKPAGIQTVKVVKFSGNLPTDKTPADFIVEEVFNKKFLPSKDDTSVAFIDVVSKDLEPTPMLPNEFTPPDAIEKRAMFDFHSYYPHLSTWEAPVRQWQTDHLAEFVEAMKINTDGFLDKAPTEKTTKFTAETQKNAPETKIISPVTGGIVSPPSISVEAQGDAKNGLSKMEFYWDSVLVTTATKGPWVVKMPISSAAAGSEHTIRVDAIDRLRYRHSQEVVVKIGKDTVPPELSIAYPGEGEEVPADSTVTFAVDAIDRNSSIRQVTFTLDGKKFPADKQAPFTLPWTSPSEKGSHTLSVIAEDDSGNTADASVSFSVVPGALNASTQPSLLAPLQGASSSQNVSFRFFVPAPLRTKDNTISLTAKKSKGSRIEIIALPGSQISPSGVVSGVWKAEELGEYDLVVNVSTPSSPVISSKITITVTGE